MYLGANYIGKARDFRVSEYRQRGYRVYEELGLCRLRDQCKRLCRRISKPGRLTRQREARKAVRQIVPTNLY